MARHGVCMKTLLFFLQFISKIPNNFHRKKKIKYINKIKIVTYCGKIIRVSYLKYIVTRAVVVLSNHCIFITMVIVHQIHSITLWLTVFENLTSIAVSI